MADIEWRKPTYSDVEIATFWSRVQRRGPTDCWEWQGAKRGRTNKDGVRYGGFKNMNASRYLAGLLAERALTGRQEQALHSCDNPICCNPAHISIGSNQQNQLEAVARGRHFAAAKTHCRHGHTYAGENLFVRRNGMRECRTCMRNHQYARRENARG